MFCQGKYADGRACDVKAKEYGVCGRHKSQAVDGSKVDGFDKFIREYREKIIDFSILAKECEAEGLDILSIQSSFGNNLGKAKQLYKLENNLLQAATNALLLAHEYQKNYLNVFDPHLVSNVCHKIRREFLS